MSLWRGKLDAGHNQQAFALSVFQRRPDVPDLVVICDGDEVEPLRNRRVNDGLRRHRRIRDIVGTFSPERMDVKVRAPKQRPIGFLLNFL
nr:MULTISPECIES: hypothetical protein [Burkholderia cepacia complex]